MTNQTKGTTTNLSKLVAWDIDEYLGYSDEGCLVCLTQQELYLLRNPLRQMEWKTRWTSELGTEQQDRSSIAERLAYKLSGTNCIDICQAIIDCINDPESGVGDAINNVVTNASFAESRDVAQSYNDSSIGSGANPTCDLDILFGQCMQMIEYLDFLNEDVLEIFEVLTNQTEMLAQVVGNITGIDESSIDAFLAWITFVQQSIAENYTAQVTVAYREAVACEIFCIARDQNCALTPRIMFDVFKDRLDSAITIESLIKDTLDYLTSGSWSGTEIADFMFFAQLGIRSQVGRFLGNFAYADIDLRLRVYANDPDGDWTELCECVDLWTERWCDGDGNPFTDGWESNLGTYNETTLELDYEWNGSSSNSVNITYTFTQSAHITRLRLQGRSRSPGSSRPTWVRLYDDEDNLIEESMSTIPAGSSFVAVDEEASGLDVDVDAGWYLNYVIASTYPDGQAYVERMLVEGTGTNPFEA